MSERVTQLYPAHSQQWDKYCFDGAAHSVQLVDHQPDCSQMKYSCFTGESFNIKPQLMRDFWIYLICLLYLCRNLHR